MQQWGSESNYNKWGSAALWGVRGEWAESSVLATAWHRPYMPLHYPSSSAPVTGGCDPGQEGLKSWWPSFPQTQWPGAQASGWYMQWSQWSWQRTLSQNISSLQREVKLPKVIKVTLCYFSLRWDEKKKFNFDSDTYYTGWKLPWAKELHLLIKKKKKEGFIAHQGKVTKGDAHLDLLWWFFSLNFKDKKTFL